MPWARIDDDLITNPKIMSVGAEAKLLYMFSIIHCSKNLTDGFVTEKVGPVLARYAGITDYPTARDELLDIGLWETAEGGYNVHDYLEYNYSRDEVQALREERAKAGSIGGKNSAASKAQAKAKQVLEQNSSKPQAKLNPIPIPDPIPIPITGNEDNASQAPHDGVGPYLDLVKSFWHAKRFKTEANKQFFLRLREDRGEEIALVAARVTAENGKPMTAVGYVEKVADNKGR
ncbi:MAG: hypothetical protein PHQ43_13580, partial [Dehalococcoidales bacterium]|nr:hypothetical protein [Dehalococcoidales bacterium]